MMSQSTCEFSGSGLRIVDPDAPVVSAVRGDRHRSRLPVKPDRDIHAWAACVKDDSRAAFAIT